jgi:hypothetical protein
MDIEAISDTSGSETASMSGLDTRSNADTTDEREEEEENGGISEAQMNAERNRTDGILTEEERELKALIDLGKEQKKKKREIF